MGVAEEDDIAVKQRVKDTLAGDDLITDGLDLICSILIKLLNMVC